MGFHACGWAVVFSLPGFWVSLPGYDSNGPALDLRRAHLRLLVAAPGIPPRGAGRRLAGGRHRYGLRGGPSPGPVRGGLGRVGRVAGWGNRAGRGLEASSSRKAGRRGRRGGTLWLASRSLTCSCWFFRFFDSVCF